MTEQDNTNPYEFWEKLEEGAEQERAERTKAFDDAMNEFSQKAHQKRQELAELMDKAMESDKQDRKEQRETALARARAEAVEKVEQEFERTHNVKSEKTQRLDNAYSALLDDLMK